MLIKKHLIILLCITSLNYSFTTNHCTKINLEDSTKITYLKTFSSGDEDIITKQINAQSPTKKTIKINISRKENTPYTFDYDYMLFDNKDEYQIDMQSVMEPMNFYIADNVKLNYTGDKITYPKALSTGMELPNLTGEMTTLLQNVFSKKTMVSIKNRKVLEKETLTIGSKTYETFLITYTLTETNKMNGKTITSLTSQVKEWYNPTYGILKEEVNQSLENVMETEIKQTSSNYVLVATKIEAL